MLHFISFNYNIIVMHIHKKEIDMKQLIASISNQTINGLISILLNALYAFTAKTLRGLALFVAIAFIVFVFVCFLMGAKEFFHRLPTSIEIIKTFF